MTHSSCSGSYSPSGLRFTDDATLTVEVTPAELDEDEAVLRVGVGIAFEFSVFVVEIVDVLSVDIGTFRSRRR